MLETLHIRQSIKITTYKNTVRSHKVLHILLYIISICLGKEQMFYKEIFRLKYEISVTNPEGTKLSTVKYIMLLHLNSMGSAVMALTC